VLATPENLENSGNFLILENLGNFKFTQGILVFVSVILFFISLAQGSVALGWASHLLGRILGHLLEALYEDTVFQLTRQILLKFSSVTVLFK